MKKVFLSAAMVAAIFSSCGSSQKSVSLAGEWSIVSVDGNNVAEDKDAFIGFDMKDGRLYGNAGCNNIIGAVDIDSLEGSIKLSNVGATRMMCKDMDLEGKVLAALEKVAGYRASETGVELTDADGNLLFGLEKKVAPVANVADLDGEWIISRADGNKVNKVEETPFIVINVAEKNVFGTGGCNNFNGGFSQEENKPESFVFGELVTTMKAGPGMEQERVILDALSKVRSFNKKSDMIISLLDENQVEVVSLVKNTGKSLAE